MYLYINININIPLVPAQAKDCNTRLHESLST